MIEEDVARELVARRMLKHARIEPFVPLCGDEHATYTAGPGCESKITCPKCLLFLRMLGLNLEGKVKDEELTYQEVAECYFRRATRARSLAGPLEWKELPDPGLRPRCVWYAPGRPPKGGIRFGVLVDQRFWEESDSGTHRPKADYGDHWGLVMVVEDGVESPAFKDGGTDEPIFVNADQVYLLSEEG